VTPPSTAHLHAENIAATVSKELSKSPRDGRIAVLERVEVWREPRSRAMLERRVTRWALEAGAGQESVSRGPFSVGARHRCRSRGLSLQFEKTPHHVREQLIASDLRGRWWNALRPMIDTNAPPGAI